MDKEIIKEIWKDVKRNFLVPIIMGTILFVLITAYVSDFEGMMYWYYIAIGIATSGTVATIIYSIRKYFKLKKKDNA